MVRGTACVAFFILLLFCISAQSAQVSKTWDFNLQHGSLQIGVDANRSGSIALSIGPSHAAPEAPIEEQIEPLNDVLAQLQGLGLDPQKISYLSTHMYNQSILNTLAYACADSSAWQSSMRAGGAGKERLVIDLLNQSGAYAAYNKVFNRYGIQARVTEAEMVGLMRFSQIPPRNAGDRKKARMLVPADAILGLRFSRSDRSSAKE